MVKMSKTRPACPASGAAGQIHSKGVDVAQEQTADAPAPAKAFKYQNPVLVGVVTLFAGIAVALIQYKIPTIMTSIMGLFSMDAATASWLMSIFTLMSIFVAIPAGYLAQRFGAKRMMIVALGIAVVGSLVGLLAKMSALLIVSRAIEGIALTVLTTCGPIIVQKCVRPEKIGTTMGIWGIWGCLGSTIAAVVTPNLFVVAGFRGVWIAYAVVAVVAAVVVAVVVRMPRDEDLFQAIEDAAAGQPAPVSGLAAYKEIFTKNIALFFVGFAIFNICLLSILAFVPTILQMQDFDPTLSGFISTAPMLCSILSSPLFGVISDKIGRVKPLLCLAMLVMGPCTFLMFNYTNALMWVAVALMGLIGMGGVGMFLSAFTKLLPRPELGSIGMGVMVCIQGVGQFLGTFLVQMLLGPDLTNWMFAGLVIMVLGFVGTASLALIKMR